METFPTEGSEPLLSKLVIKDLPAPLSRQATVGLTPRNAQYFLIFSTKTIVSNERNPLNKEL